ncbi:MAG: hypothetical protein IJY42_02800 [Clostridia bacterium]|nr:hypothetical protein [Clostridia bacterium]
MQEQKDFSIPSRIILGLLALAVVAYTLFHASSLFREDFTTIAAGTTTEYTTVSASGYLFRDETVLYSPNGGVADYLVEDGAKVSIGQSLAYVYEGYDGSALQPSIRFVDQQIALLEQSQGNMTADEAQAVISDQYASLVKMLASGSLGGLSDTVNGMLTAMNRMDMLSGQGGQDVEKTLEELYAVRSRLLGSAQGLLHTAEESGYFYSVTDGYESIFTREVAKTLTADRFYTFLTESGNGRTNRSEETAYGKIAANSQWDFVMMVSAHDAAFFTEGERYEVAFSRSENLSLPMTLEAKVGAEGDADLLLRFSCDRLPANFVPNRCENVHVIVASRSGLYVPQHAVERVDGKLGVYILRGSVVRFRCIEVIYEGNGYYLVAQTPSEEDPDAVYLGANDLIILNGYQLFDGRILE